MFKKKEYHKKRANFLPYAVFRFFLSLFIFAILVGGLYSAYRSFSGRDPLKADLGAVAGSFFAPAEFKKLTGLSLPDNLASKLSQTSVDKVVPLPKAVPSTPAPKNLLFSFLLIADSHSENNYLGKALAQAKVKKPDLKFIIGLGDYTEVGTLDEFKKTKAELDSADLRYFLVPGDHDLWDARNKNLLPQSEYEQIFGTSFQAFTFNSIRFILLNNADNYTGLGSEQKRWLDNEVNRDKQDKDLKEILVFTHEPLYHPSSPHTQGMVETKLKDEASNLIQTLKLVGVKEVFSGDIHYFTRYSEPQTGLAMTTIGAVASQRNPQNPRYSIVDVYEDYTYDVGDLEIK